MDKASSLLEPEETVDETTASPTTSYRAPLRPIESGVFPGARAKVNDDSLVGSLQGALTAASRGEAGLTSLHRSLRDASRALTASRHAHQALTERAKLRGRHLRAQRFLPVTREGGRVKQLARESQGRRHLALHGCIEREP